MYVLDFLKNLFHRNKIAVMIYLLLNYIFIFTFFGGVVIFSPSAWSDGSWVWGLFALLVYPISLCIALSPVGEYFLRTSQGCIKINKTNYASRLEPLFYEVYKKAKTNAPNLPDGIKVFICEDEEANAFATGRQTICVTKGFLDNYSDEQIKGALAHEFGHLAHNDTDITLAVAIGNIIVTVIFYVMYFIMILANAFLSAIADENGGWGWLFDINNWIMKWSFALFMWIWTKMGLLICNISNRRQEYDADKFALECGYGDQLYSVISTFGKAKSKQGLFSALMSSHPRNELRLKELENNNAILRNPQTKNEMTLLDANLPQSTTSITIDTHHKLERNNKCQNESRDVHVQDGIISSNAANTILPINEISQRPSFCPFCGAKALSKFCGQCGRKIPDFAVYQAKNEMSSTNTEVSDSNKTSNSEYVFSSTKDIYSPNAVFSGKNNITDNNHLQEKTVDKAVTSEGFTPDGNAESMFVESQNVTSVLHERTETQDRIIIFDDEEDENEKLIIPQQDTSVYDEDLEDTGRIIIFDDEE